jgi:hypothetical protein
MLLTNLPLNVLKRVVFYLKDVRDIVSLMLTCKIFNLHEIDHLNGLLTLPSGKHIPLRYFMMVDHVKRVVLRHVLSKHVKIYKKTMEKTLNVNIEGLVEKRPNRLDGDKKGIGYISFSEKKMDETNLFEDEEWLADESIIISWEIGCGSPREWVKKRKNGSFKNAFPYSTYSEPYPDRNLRRFLSSVKHDLENFSGLYKHVAIYHHLPPGGKNYGWEQIGIEFYNNRERTGIW